MLYNGIREGYVRGFHWSHRRPSMTTQFTRAAIELAPLLQKKIFGAPAKSRTWAPSTLPRLYLLDFRPLLKSTTTSLCLPLAPTSPNNLSTSNNLSQLVRVALDFSCLPTRGSFQPCLLCLSRAYLHRCTHFPRSSCHSFLFDMTSPLAAESQRLEGVSSSLDI